MRSTKGMRMNKTLALFFAAMLLTILACGGGGGGGGGTSTSGGGTGGGNNGVVLDKNNVTIARGQSVNFSASVPGQQNQTVIYRLSPETFGTLTQTGQNTATYTAPNAAGTATIIATSDANPNLTATAKVTVTAVGVTIEPKSAQIARNGKITFKATVVGAADSRVTWTATAGTFNVNTGTQSIYTAPNTTGTFVVTARSVSNPNVFDQAQVKVVATGGQNATVTGRVVNDVNAGLSGVQVVFIDVDGDVLAQTTAQADGRFSASVPTTAREFNLVPSTIPNSVYRTFSFNSNRYTPLSITCGAPLPTLTGGATVALATAVELPRTSNPPPPPPNGCS